MQPLHREVVVAVHEAAGDVLVQRVGEHRVADLGVGGVAADQLVPAGLGVEHRRPQLAARLDAGRLERRVGHPGRRRCRARRRRARRPAAGPDRRSARAPGRPARRPRRGRGRRRSSSCRRRRSRARAPSPCSPAARRARPATVARRLRGLGHQAHSARPALRPARLATRATTRRPVALVNSSGTYSTGRSGRDAGAQPLEVPVADAPAGLGDLGRGEHLAHAGPGRLDEQLLPRRSLEAGRPPRPGAGRTAPAARGWRRSPTAPRRSSRSSRPSRSIVSVTGISSGVVTTTSPVRAGPRGCRSSSRLVAHHADLHQLADHPRRADLGDDVAARLGVDDDEVVVALARPRRPACRRRGSPSRPARRRRRSRTCGPAGRCARRAGP